MTWSVDTGSIANLLSTIASRLTAAGWTDADPGYNVFTSTNDQGALNCLQITNCQSNGSPGSGSAWQYLQFQGWRTWDTGSHAGADGSGVTYRRLYYAAANVPGTATVDLFMSVTSNRLIMAINGIGAFYSWGYFGGLDSSAGTTDPTCVVLMASFAYVTSTSGAVVLYSPLTASAWPNIQLATAALIAGGGSRSQEDPLVSVVLTAQYLSATTGKAMVFPVVAVDGTTTALTIALRGSLDGLCYCPTGGRVAHMEEVTVDGVTYLVFVPGGTAGSSSTIGHPLSTQYSQAIAIAEV